MAMLRIGDRIEFSDLSAAEHDEVMLGCAGEPVTDPRYLSHFLETAGFPALAPKAREKWEQMRSLTQAGAQTMNTDSPDAITRFNRGAMFYAGVTSIANNYATLPCNPLLLAASVKDVTIDFVLDQAAALKTETGDFYELMIEVRTALDPTEDDRLFNVSVAGAGIMHYIAKESFDVDARDPDRLAATFPELSGLFDPFEPPPIQ